MILSAQSIRRLCSVKPYLIIPFYERSQHKEGLSYGLSSCGYDIRLREPLYISPGQFKLGSSIEAFRLPDNLLMRIVDKSTWARQGLAVQNTVAEPGWNGYLTLEITNHTNLGISVPAGTPIAQVLFETLDKPTQQPYEGKYQNQPAHPVEAK